MKFNINTKDVDLSEKDKLVILDKLSDLNELLVRYDPDVLIVDVRAQKGARFGYKLSFSMWLPGKKHIFAEVKNKKLISASTELRDTVERQIRDFKEQLEGKRNR